nr:hypothetical protein [Marinitoga sp. 1154]
MRNSFYDFSILNSAVSVDEERNFRISIGTRPAVAKLATKAMEYLKNNNDIEEASKIAAEEMEYGSNIKASKEYRKMIAPVLVKRGLEEVIQ